MKKTTKERSYSMTQEALSKLAEIKTEAGSRSNSEAVRHCIDVAYEQLLTGKSSTPPEQLLTLVEKIYVLLRYLHIENVKQHQGTLKELDVAGTTYLKNLQTEMKAHLTNFKGRGLGDE